MGNTPTLLDLEAKIAAFEIALIALMQTHPDRAAIRVVLHAIQRDARASQNPAVCEHLNKLAHVLGQAVGPGVDTPTRDTH